MIETQFTPAVLALADGSIFRGVSVGVVGMRVGEVVFNTALTGYQEILTDPSYQQQLVTLTYPHIGNVGTNPEDAESTAVHAAGLIIREVPRTPSNWRNTQSLPAYLQEHNIVAIADIDTRRLTRILREKGAQNGCLIAGDSAALKALNIDAADAAAIEAFALDQARAFAGLTGMDLAKTVTTHQTFTWNEASWFNPPTNTPPSSAGDYHVVVVDFGVKHNILRCLVDAGCRLTVVPAQTQAAEILALQPDGIMLSNGPGDPAACGYAITMARDVLVANIPVFGICLGHQIMGLAAGAQTVKMKFGHHGANHPVQDIQTKHVLITSQNHGFAVDPASLPDDVAISHISLFDGSLQGLRWKNVPAFSFQGHPEASPGPRDVAPLFAEFVANMRARRAA